MAFCLSYELEPALNICLPWEKQQKLWVDDWFNVLLDSNLVIYSANLIEEHAKYDLKDN